MFDNFISLLYNLAFCWMWKLSDKPAIPLNKKLHGYAIVYDNFAATCHDDSTVLIPILEEMKKSEGPQQPREGLSGSAGKVQQVKPSQHGNKRSTG